MFNYQSGIYDSIVDTWRRLNVSRSYNRAAETLYVAVNVLYEMIPLSIRQSTLLNNLYKEWKMYNDETYNWIHPKLMELSNTSLHYGIGVSVGILLSILVFILTKFLPSRLKHIGYILMLIGGSVSLGLLFSSVGNFFSDPVTKALVENIVVVIAGIIIFELVYRYEPMTDERNNIVKRRNKNLKYKFFPPKIKLLTEDEYIMQGNIETRKELEKLREYCRSPDRQTWKIISRLKNPHRFAEFVEGNSWHVTDEELLDYDSGPDPPPPHLISDDDEDDI